MRAGCSSVPRERAPYHHALDVARAFGIWNKGAWPPC